MDDYRTFSNRVKLSVVMNNMKKNNGVLKCEMCGRQLFERIEVHYDHIVPYSKGGHSSEDNCQILCVDCNLSKTDKDMEDFILEREAKKFVFADDNNEEENVTVTRETTENNKQVKWNRETAESVLREYYSKEGHLSQKDLKSSNGLPSYPCVMRLFAPEFDSWNDIKAELFGCKKQRIKWTKQELIDVGKKHVREFGKDVTEATLNSDNGMPSYSVVLKHFDSIEEYQKAIGANITRKNAPIAKDQVKQAVDVFFLNTDRRIESRRRFFYSFTYSESLILKLFGTFDNFCDECQIEQGFTRRIRYSKQEVDVAINTFVKKNKYVPRACDLTSLGLPSSSTICKFYPDYKTPFIMFMKMQDMVGNTSEDDT